MGSVSWYIYKKYFQAVGGYFLVALIVLSYFIESMTKVAADWYSIFLCFLF